MCVGQESQEITVTLPDGKTVGGASWKTTPYDVASQISKGLADNTVIAKVCVCVCVSVCVCVCVCVCQCVCVCVCVCIGEW